MTVTVTVNSERYVSMLEHFLQPKMEEIVEEEEVEELWFQQDVATAHAALNSLNTVF